MRHGLLIQYRRVALEPPGGIQDEMLEQQGNVFSPLSKRRQFDECDAKAIVEIRAKQLFIAQLEQVRLARCHDPAIHRDRLIRSDAFDPTILQ